MVSNRQAFHCWNEAGSSCRFPMMKAVAKSAKPAAPVERHASASTGMTGPCGKGTKPQIWSVSTTGVKTIRKLAAVKSSPASTSSSSSKSDSSLNFSTSGRSFSAVLKAPALSSLEKTPASSAAESKPLSASPVATFISFSRVSRYTGGFVMETSRASSRPPSTPSKEYTFLLPPIETAARGARRCTTPDADDAPLKAVTAAAMQSAVAM
mmetsp:Transcript_6126/g.18343  ORF Transcript_6126/g.18343 Transcript_6126/m.18343 type:complete len:210 (-) Transcript_6126:28-657(-)